MKLGANVILFCYTAHGILIANLNVENFIGGAVVMYDWIIDNEKFYEKLNV